VLDVEERVRVAERSVVDPRQVPRVVHRQPERQRHERPEEREADRAVRKVRRDSEHEECRRPLCENDVLQQVRPEERVVRERLELREERREHKEDPERAGGQTRPRDGAAAGYEDKPDRERRHEPDGLR